MRQTQRRAKIIDRSGLPVILGEDRNSRLFFRRERVKHAGNHFRLLRPAHHVVIHLGQLPARLSFHLHAVHIPELGVFRGRIQRKNWQGQRRSDDSSNNEWSKDCSLDPISGVVSYPRFDRNGAGGKKHWINGRQIIYPPPEDQELGEEEKIRPSKKAE